MPPPWKTAQPSDQIARGKWWEIFQDPQLNALEEQINVSNENLKAAEAQFRQARALVRFNRAAYYPTVTAGASAAREHLSEHRPLVSTTTQTNVTDLVIPVDVSYEADVFGRVRHTVEAARSNAQASAADLESVRLSLHAELAFDYFQMRTLDAEEQLLKSNVTSFERALELTQEPVHRRSGVSGRCGTGPDPAGKYTDPGHRCADSASAERTCDRDPDRTARFDLRCSAGGLELSAA